MPRRSSSLLGTDVAISREISSNFDDVKIVADNIEDIINVSENLDSKVDSSRVLTDVPENAIFTDTLYDDTAIQEDIDSKIPISDLLGAIGNINAPLLDLPLINNLDFETGQGKVSFERATTATYVDRYGVLKYAVEDEPRFEKDGLLIEGASTNEIIYSEDITNAVWSRNTGVTTPTATHLVTSATDISQALAQAVGTITVGTNLTYSVIVEKDFYDYCLIQIRNVYTAGWQQTGYVFSTDTFTASGGEIISKKSTILADGKVLLEINLNPTDVEAVCSVAIMGSTSTSTAFLGNGTNGLFVHAQQLEKLPFKTSYIPTTDSPVTRGADTVEIDRYGNLPIFTDGATISVNIQSNKSTSTTFVDFVANGESGQCRVRSGSTGNLYFALEDNTGVKASDAFNTVDYALIYTESVSAICTFEYGGGDMSGYGNGVIEEIVQFSDYRTSTPMPSSGKITLGRLTNGSEVMYGHIKNLKIYDKALTPTEVKLLGGKQ